jgi:hypothetical protein
MDITVLSRRARQHVRPLFIDRLDETGTARLLDPLGFDRGEIQHDEGWLQKLIFRFPQLLPVHEIEPGFSPIVPVCLELPTPAGNVDNLYITERGDLVIAECKLWRNPEARREVVAQVIDYAHGMASWTYMNLEDAVRKSSVVDGEKPPTSLYELIEEIGEIDEAGFVDAVSRNLRLGRMMLLIVGDGIREGVESLSSFLQLHAGFHFALGIVEMPVFRLPHGGLIVQPRVLARTVNIERGIVKVADGHRAIVESVQKHGADETGRRTSISQERLLEILAAVEPGLPSAILSFADRAADLGVVLDEATKSLQLRWRGPGDQSFALGGINEHGEFLTYNVNWQADFIGHIELAHEYLEKIAALIGGEVRKTVKPGRWHVTLKGTKQVPNAMVLLTRQDEWLALIGEYTEKLRVALVEAGDV